MHRIASSFMLCALIVGCALPSQRISPHGRSTMVHTDRYRLNGELVAVTEDTVWLFARPDSSLVSVPRPSIVRLDVQRHQMSTGRTVKLMALAGAATGVLLAIACSSVDDDCGMVIPAITLPFVGLGAVFGVFNFESAWMKHEPGEISRARSYARFPQGIPDTLRIAPRASP
jgi:hypothetical protein